MPLLQTCHAAVPFSTSEQYVVMGKMNTMMLFFGPPSLFYTVVPNDIDNELSLCLSMGHRQARIPLPEVSRRFEALSENPAAVARIFERQVRAFLEVLLGLPSSKQTKKDCAVRNRKKGLFSTCVAHSTCYECQGRGCLQFHGLFCGGIAPWLLDMAVGNTKLVQAVPAVLDQQICAAFDAHIHREYEERLEKKVEAPHMREEKQLLPQLPNDPHEAAREIARLPQRSLATFKSTGVSLPIAANHRAERVVAVLGCLVKHEKGTMIRTHISLWCVIPLWKGTTSRCMNHRWNSMPMMRR